MSTICKNSVKQEKKVSEDFAGYGGNICLSENIEYNVGHSNSKRMIRRGKDAGRVTAT